jgi:hypothetical protein
MGEKRNAYSILVRVEYGHESRETGNQEWLCWRAPAAIYPNDQSALSFMWAVAVRGWLSEISIASSRYLATTSDDRLTNTRLHMRYICSVS